MISHFDDRTHLLSIDLAEIDQGPAASEASLSGESLLLQAVTQFHDRHVLVHMAPGCAKDVGLGKLMDDLSPDDKGGFRIEIGAVLPIWLPDLKARPNFAVDVASGADSVRLAFSNRMLKIRYRKSDQPIHALVPQFHLDRFLGEQNLPDGYHVEPCKTMAAARFEATGANAEEALERSIDRCRDQFIAALNVVLGGHLELATPEVPILASRLDLGSFEAFYVTMQGGDPNKARATRYARRLWDVHRNPGREYTLAETEHFFAMTTGGEPVSDVRHLLNTGKSLIESASLEFGFLQIMIAAEIATRRVAHKLITHCGVSKKTLKNYDRELHFGQILNVHLVSLCPANLRPDKTLLQRIDWGRKLRNDLMHEATFKATRQELRELHRATTKFLDFLAKVDQSTSETIPEGEGE